MFQTVLVGGTFDTLHKGHIALLRRAYGEGERVIIGLTSDAYVKEYKSGTYKSFNERKDALLQWLNDNGYHDRTTLIPIDNPYEPAASEEYHALMVTSETKIKGEEINSIREKRDLPPLSLIEVPLVAAEDGLTISSSRVRTGAIDEAGHLIMPESLRTLLQKPIGRVLVGEDVDVSRNQNAKKILITVGDVTAHNFLSAGFAPSLAILDLHVNRKPYQTRQEYAFPEGTTFMTVTSGPGYISRQAEDAIRAWASSVNYNLKAHMVIEVTGEEDLLVIPVIIHAPIGSVVYYGQPPYAGHKEGLVEVIVTEDTKKQSESLLAQFSS